MIQALAKIRAEMEANAKNPNLQRIGSYLLDYVRKHPEVSDKILADGKTLKGSVEAMKGEARRVAFEGCGMLTDEEGYAIVLNYFDINKARQPALNLLLDDLLPKT